MSRSFEKNFTIYSDCLNTPRPVEYTSIERQKDRLILASSDDISTCRHALEVSSEWLPLAAEKYCISADLRDYILVPTIICSSVLPNRNGIGFPYETLAEWNPEAKQIAYKTYTGSPLHINHDNKDYTKARGVVLDTVMRPMPGTVGGLWKVICLCAFDRKRDPMLANKLMTEKTSAMSLGCWASGYECSVCGHAYQPRPKPLPPVECEHVVLNRMKHYKTFKVGGKDLLAYYKAYGMTGFEISHVPSPAFVSASPDLEDIFHFG